MPQRGYYANILPSGRIHMEYLDVSEDFNGVVTWKTEKAALEWRAIWCRRERKELQDRLRFLDMIEPRVWKCLSAFSR